MRVIVQIILIIACLTAGFEAGWFAKAYWIKKGLW